MLTAWEKVIFAFLILAAAGAFLHPILRRLKIIRAGGPRPRWNAPLKRLGHATGRVLLQRCTIRGERPFTGLMHVLIFYGALSFDTMTLNHTLEGFFSGFSLFGSGWFGLFFSFLIDAAAVAVMAGVAFLAFRRFVLRPKAYATTPGDSAVIYALITLATLTYLYFEGFAVAHHPDPARLSFLGTSIAGAIRNSGLSPEAVASNFRIAWWAHIVVVYAFIAYVPHSKYLHMFAGPFNVFFRRDAPSGELETIDLENSEVYGVEKLTEFSWKDDLDAFACMECGRCQDACPAFASGKPLSPKMIVYNLERGLLANHAAVVSGKREDLAGLVPGTFTEGEIWTCTTCGACMKVCPVEIEHIDKIVGTRRSQVLMESRFPQELNALFRNLETNANPWGLGFAKRGDWAKGLDVMHISTVRDAEVLFWVGCLGAYDDAGRKVARALAEILGRAGVRYGTLGTDEKCCGDSARRLGNEYLFQSLAQENISLFREHGVRRIVTICPHGYNTFKHEYPKLLDTVPGLSAGDKDRLRAIEVVSHVELIRELLSSGRVSLKPPDRREAYTYHDPCYLGRHNGLVKEPRQLLASVLGTGRREMGNHGLHSFCCGAGGGLMWTEESLGRRINHLRVDEVIRSRAGLAAVACPFCLTMLKDGLKDKNREDVEVKDIAQLIADRLA